MGTCLGIFKWRDSWRNNFLLQITIFHLSWGKTDNLGWFVPTIPLACFCDRFTLNFPTFFFDLGHEVLTLNLLSIVFYQSIVDFSVQFH